MIARSMLAAAAVTALMVGATPAARAADAKAAKTQKELTDPEGNKLSLGLDDTGKVVSSAATDAKGKALPVRQIKLKDTSMCIPGAKGATLCQPLAFLSDGTFLRMGSATCRCQFYNGILICYGDTCQ